MNPWLISIPLAYLLGSIPFGFLLVLLLHKQDVRTTGSGNIGATNVARSGGRMLGLLTLLLDVAKAYVAVKIAQHFTAGSFAGSVSDLAVAAGVTAVLGHVFPVWLRFRGGKGVASALGAFLALSPLLALCLVAVFVLVFALTRYVSLASIIAAASAPLFLFYLVHHLTITAFAGFLFICLLVILKHHANIRRLLAGTESRFGSTSSPKAAA